MRVRIALVVTGQLLEQEAEILTSVRRIEEEVKARPRFFAYPRGKTDTFNHETRACLYEARIDLAFSYYGGFNLFGEIDAYDVKRAPVELTTRMEHFEAIVSLPQVFAS